MLPNNILQSDILDLLFENRNKAYGAYVLRKNYPQRLKAALAAVTGLVLVTALLQFELKGKYKNVAPPIIDSITVLPVTITPEEVKQPIAKKVVQPKRQAQIQSPLPLIVKDSLAKDTVAKVEELNNNKIGAQTIDGPPAVPELAGTSGNGTGNGEAPKVMKPIVPIVLENADVMPQFPGGMDAFEKFLTRNLNHPDDLEAAESILVKAKFIVSADGSIEGIEILQSGRKDLDAEVIRVLHKMPKWIPGMQDGKNVAVYFKLPVTFVGPDE
jgi:protein TonB